MLHLCSLKVKMGILLSFRQGARKLFIFFIQFLISLNNAEKYKILNKKAKDTKLINV